MPTLYATPSLTTWGYGNGGWAATSGGTPTGGWPDATTDVIFDANSGPARTIAMDNTSAFPVCNTLVTTGSNSMTLASSSQLFITTSANITWTGTSIAGGIIFNGAGNKTLICPNCAIANLTSQSTSTITLGSNITVTGSLIPYGGINSTFDAAGFNVTCGTFATSSYGNATLKMGSGTWSITGINVPVWSVVSGSTVIPSTSTIKITDVTANTKGFQGGGFTYNNLWVAGTNLSLQDGGNTFNDIKIAPGANFYLTPSTTTTCTTLTADGTGAVITLRSNTAGSAATLAKAGGGRINVDYCSIKDITATPALTFFARSSTNVSGNTGWTFLPGNCAFLQFF